MIPVQEARDRILAALRPGGVELVPLRQAAGRVLARDAAARRDQPPLRVSAMDGYAVRAVDCATVPVDLTIVGEAAAGGGHSGIVGSGQAVRIFTGGPVPDGADAVVMQEDTTPLAAGAVRIHLAPHAGKFIRPAALDFAAGDILLRAGRRLSIRDVALLAAMNLLWIPVYRRPMVTLLSTGNEVVMPGEQPGPAGVFSSSSLGLAALVEALGGSATILEIARDDAAALSALASTAAPADMLVTTAGVSVGDHDLVQSALGRAGLTVDFWKVAMRPGKPLLSGSFTGIPFLGLPGNPVSALVVALVFLAPALARLSGLPDDAFTPYEQAVAGCDLPGNPGKRQAYLRAGLTPALAGPPVVIALPNQDSAGLAELARADCLLIQPPDAPPAAAGDPVSILRFPGSGTALL